MAMFYFSGKLFNRAKEEIAGVDGIVLKAYGFGDAEKKIHTKFIGKRQWLKEDEEYIDDKGKEKIFDSTVAVVKLNKLESEEDDLIII